MTKQIQTPEDQVKIFDTTLRDGEQSPGASMTLPEKLRIAAILDEMGVDIIEAGFPIASNGDFEAVSEVAKMCKSAIVAGLARASKRDIDRAWEALQHARRPRIHTFISTSPLHMKHKLQMEPEEVAEAVKMSVSHARNLCEDVEWSCEDGTRTEPDFLCRTVEIAIKAGATTVNIPDTVGYTTPDEYFELITMMKNRVPNIDMAVISTHCHNDLGLGVANSLAAVRAGARQVECTINGLGERAGNAALEEIVMALKVRADAMPYWTGINPVHFTKISKTVSQVTGFPVQYNKAIVGKNAFAHESGIHQDGMLKNAETYEIMTPESVGLLKTNLVMGKHSGRHAFREKLKEMGYDLGENAFQDAFARFKALADKKKTIYDEDLIALVDDEVMRGNDAIKFKSLRVVAGSEGPQEASLVLDVEGTEKSIHVEGQGPVDATFLAIKEITGMEPHLALYQVHAVTAGTDAQAEVSVRLEQGGHVATGQGADTDTLVASAKAYLNALNRLIIRQQKSAPEDLQKAG